MAIKVEVQFEIWSNRDRP